MLIKPLCTLPAVFFNPNCVLALSKVNLLFILINIKRNNDLLSS